MKLIRHTKTLFYYDGPQVIEARDAIGGHYVGVMVAPANDQDRYLVKGVSPESLRRFRAGLVDLRSMLLERDDGDWFLALAPQGLEHPLEMVVQDGSLADSGLLPDPDFLLQDHASMSNDLEALNPNQRLAAQWNDGPLLVLAGPGSGKTEVLTVRAARMLEELPGVSVLALTFTTKAADEMRERLEGLLGGRTDRAHLCTYHSFAGDILRQYGSKVGVRPDFSLLTTEEDRIAFLEAMLDPRTGNAPSYAADVPGDRRNVLTLLDRLFAESYDGGTKVPSLPHPPQWIPALFNDYCETLIQANRLDFGALLHLAKRVLAEHPHTAKMLRYGWTHLSVDEFQDTNRAQYDLLKLVVEAGDRNLFVVADDDQILYQWNGASPERLLALQKDYGMNRVQLPRNYRCPPEIIDLANELISHNSTRTPDKSSLVADRVGEDDNPVIVKEFNTDSEEAAGIAEMILERGIKPADCVVLARNAKILKGVAEALEEAGIKAWLTQRKNEFESAPARWCHSMLRLANSRHDRELVRRACVAWKEMGNPLIEVNDVEAEAALDGGDFLRAWLSLAGSAADPVLTTVRDNLAERSDFIGAIAAFWKRHEDDADPLVAEEIAVWKELDGSIRGRIGDEHLTLHHYLQEMDMLSKAALRPDDAVPCITVHGAKGGEFNHVFLAGMAEEIFPSFQAVRKGDDSPEMEEERRSCFVAITRVQRTLTITLAHRYSGYRKQPSRFLREMYLI